MRFHALTWLALGAVACNSLLELDDVQYAEPTASTGMGGSSTGTGGAGGSAGGGGAGVLEGEPQWLYHAAQAPGEQRVTDLSWDGARAAAVLVNRGTMPLAPLNADSVAAASGNDQVLLSIDDAGELQRGRSWGNDLNTTTAEVACRQDESFVVGTYEGTGISIDGNLSASCAENPCSTTDLYAAKFDRDLDVRWRTSQGPTLSNEGARSVAVQGDRRVLIGGGFSTATDLFDTAVTPVGDVDAFVFALEDEDVLGWDPEWVWTTGTGSATAWAMALATDESSVAVLLDRPRPGGRDATLHRLDDTGTETWTFPVAFAGSATPRGVAISPVDGAVHLAVALTDATDLPDGTTHTPAEGATLVLASYTTDQDERWFELLEATDLGIVEIASDPSGNLVVGVSFTDSFTLPGGTTLTEPGASAVAFKLDRDGELIWHHQLTTPTTGSVEIRAVAALPDGSSLYGGSFTGTIDFDLEVASATTGSGADGRDGFVLKLGP